MKRTSNTTAGSPRSSRGPRRAPPSPPAPPGADVPPVAELLRGFGEVAHRLGVTWYLFGAQAVAAYGVPRTTADVDLTVTLGAASVEDLVVALRRAGFTLTIDDAAFIAATRVLPMLHTTSGWQLDVILAGPGLEELFTARAVPRLLAGVRVPLIAPDDLIATKLLASRPKDLDDVRALLAMGADLGLDRARLHETIAMLEDAVSTSELAPLLARLEAEAALATAKPTRTPTRTPGTPTRTPTTPARTRAAPRTPASPARRKR